MINISKVYLSCCFCFICPSISSLDFLPEFLDCVVLMFLFLFMFKSIILTLCSISGGFVFFSCLLHTLLLTWLSSFLNYFIYCVKNSNLVVEFPFHVPGISSTLLIFTSILSTFSLCLCLSSLGPWFSYLSCNHFFFLVTYLFQSLCVQ